MADYHSGAQNNTAAALENQAAAPPAHTVGEEFVRQFYHVLTQLPHLAHRFYTDESSLTYSGAVGAAITVQGQQDIDEKIRSLNLSGAQTEVTSVDAQYSLHGGVTVLVTGRILTGQDQKAFVQTFFLATQEKGYYVLNDTFRYLQDPTKSHSPDFPVSDASANGNPQQYAMQHEANGYGSIGRASSAGGQHNQPPSAQPTPAPPQAQVSAFQQVNGHAGSTHTSQDLGHGQLSGDLAQNPSPAGSQGLPPPPPKPSAATVPTQQTPPSPPQETTEPEQPAEQAQQQPTEQESGDQLVAQPAVDQNRPPVKSQRKPSTSVSQAAASEAAAAATTPSKVMSYADLLRQKDSSAAQASNRPQTPSQPSSSAAASSQAPAPSAPTAALPQRTPSARQQSRAPTASADSASSDQSAKENQPANQVLDRPSQGGPSRPPYSQGQGFRDEESSKRAVFVTNIPEEATTEELRELFGQFGSVKAGAGAVTLKKSPANGRGPFAYLDFADAASAQAAIDASTVEFKGVELKIQAKRPQSVFPRGRGGYGMRGGSTGFGRGGRGNDRGNDRNFGSSGRGNGPTPAPVEVVVNGSADRGQGGSGRGGQGSQSAGRGRGGRDGGRGGGGGGRDGGRGRGRGPSRTSSQSGTEMPAAPQAVPAE